MFHLRLSRFHAGSGDTYPTYNDADPRGLRVENLLGNLKQMNITYFFGKINASTDMMIREFRNVIRDEEFVREIDMQNPRNIFAMTLESVASTIEIRMNATLAIRYEMFSFEFLVSTTKE